jgi:hypothetical protein
VITSYGRNKFNIVPKELPNEIEQLNIVATLKFIMGLFLYNGCLKNIGFINNYLTKSRTTVLIKHPPIIKQYATIVA